MTTIAVLLALALTVPVYRPSTLKLTTLGQTSDKDRRIMISGPGGVDTLCGDPVIYIKGLRPGLHRVEVRVPTGEFAMAVVECPAGGVAELEVHPRHKQRDECYMHGRVYDSRSKEPIAGCTVRVPAFLRSTLSIEDGSFAIDRINPTVAEIIEAITPRGDTLRATVTIHASYDAFVELTTGRTLEHEMTDGLVAAFGFDVLGFYRNQPIKDEGPGAHDGYIYGGWATADRYGTANKAVQFKEATYAEFKHDRWQSLLPMSISFFVRADTPASGASSIVSKRESPNGVGWVVFLEEGMPCFEFHQDEQQNWARVSSTTGIADGRWHHIVAAIDTIAMSVWVDGRRTTHAIGAFKPFATTAKESLRVGRSRPPGLPAMLGFTGSIDDLLFFDRVLSTDEIAELGRTR